MSRNTLYTDYRLTVVGGDDHLLGRFYQIYDRDMEQETSEGEGLVLEWSERFGYESNLTGITNKEDVNEVIVEYIREYAEPIEDTQLN